MDSYSSTSNSHTDSSSSNSSSTWFAYHYDRQQQQDFKTTKPPQPAFRSALHSVRKSPAKYVITKKPIAPLPPTPPKIYKVERFEFKDVVQQLTGALEFQPTRRLQEVAPPPLSLSPPHRQPYQDSEMKPAVSERFNEEEKRQKSFDSTFGALRPLGFNLSPSSLAWCSAMLLSPGTLASFEPSAVL